MPPPVVPIAAPHLSVDKLRTRLVEAQRLFKSAPVLTAGSANTTSIVTIAALDPASAQIHTMRLPKGTLLRKDAEMTLATSLGKTVRLRILRPNYVNTAVAIYDTATDRSLTPLLIEYPIEKGGRYREMAYYTSAHPALINSDLVRSGQSYVRTMLDLAAKRLKDKGVYIAPDLIDSAERLCMVEHVDHQRFLIEDRPALYEEIFALYALNQLDTYKYSVSTAGAGGMVQMIPATYQMLRRMHPGVGLNPDFVLGMRNHGNALEAMLIYINDTWNDLSYNSEVAYALATGLATKAELVAAGYNSNPTRLPSYLQRGAASWRTLIPRETQMYLQIYSSVDKLIPMKPRKIEKAGAPPAVNAQATVLTPAVPQALPAM
ncbi:MAG: hypothetical protein WKF30_12520 [Pyrinomonadaceae bacterium]